MCSMRSLYQLYIHSALCRTCLQHPMSDMSLKASIEHFMKMLLPVFRRGSMTKRSIGQAERLRSALPRAREAPLCVSRSREKLAAALRSLNHPVSANE
jgi:hypothetical protein